jgi:hypothetical protein
MLPFGRDLPVPIQNRSNAFRERLGPRGIQGEDRAVRLRSRFAHFLARFRILGYYRLLTTFVA